MASTRTTTGTTRYGAGSRSTTARPPGEGDRVGRRARRSAHRLPGGAGEDQLEHISWDEWFRKFEDSNLAFLYQDEKASGEDSTFFKLVER
ncbi:MAG TPA: hypothetical protein VHF24_04300 [Acidimicrobiales bacterium]|nr:hypothetical protein [Acidimicrobiales bacterium]